MPTSQTKQICRCSKQGYTVKICDTGQDLGVEWAQGSPSRPTRDFQHYREPVQRFLLVFANYARQQGPRAKSSEGRRPQRPRRQAVQVWAAYSLPPCGQTQQYHNIAQIEVDNVYNGHRGMAMDMSYAGNLSPPGKGRALQDGHAASHPIQSLGQASQDHAQQRAKSPSVARTLALSAGKTMSRREREDEFSLPLSFI